MSNALDIISALCNIGGTIVLVYAPYTLTDKLGKFDSTPTKKEIRLTRIKTTIGVALIAVGTLLQFKC